MELASTLQELAERLRKIGPGSLTDANLEPADRLLWDAYHSGDLEGWPIIHHEAAKWSRMSWEAGLGDGEELWEGMTGCVLGEWGPSAIPGYPAEPRSNEVSWFATGLLELARVLRAGPVDKATDKPAIPPEERTIPMSYRRAAKFIGKGDNRDAAEWLSKSVADGSIPCEHVTRQTHVFSRKCFPAEVWPQITPKRRKSDGNST